MKNSDYYVPQTQCNDKGVPQGAYLDMSGFIADQGLKTGKGGYQKEYPPLYVYPGGELNPCRTSVTLNFCEKGPFGCLPSAPTSLAAQLSTSFLNCIHQANSSTASASKVCSLLE